MSNAKKPSRTQRKKNQGEKGSKAMAGRAANRAGRAKMARQTLDIIKSGKLNANVSLQPLISNSIEKARFIPHNQPFPYLSNSELLHISNTNSAHSASSSSTLYEVTSETTLDAVSRLYFNSNKYNISDQSRIAALNFASAKNPGGGFLGGSSAQEESLARCSGLYPTLTKFDKEYYQYHLSLKQIYEYTDNMIYSPEVVIFRDDNALFSTREQCYTCSFITCPAVNATHFREIRQTKGMEKKNIDSELYEIMSTRIGKILDLAVREGNEAIVLGAYGCGVFGNDPEVIAKIFGEHLADKYQNMFKCVVFAIYSRNEAREKAPFERIVHALELVQNKDASISAHAAQRGVDSGVEEMKIDDIDSINNNNDNVQERGKETIAVEKEAMQSCETTEKNENSSQVNEMVGGIPLASLGPQPKE